MRQKLFALGMLVVVLAFFAASVAIPVLQGLLGLHRARPAVRSQPMSAGWSTRVVAARQPPAAVRELCLTYWRVPKGAIPWTCVWPGALGATLAMAAVDWLFPLYLAEASTLRTVRGVVVFVLIALIWC